MNSHNRPTINDVRILEGRGPWKTKSDGELNVLFGLSHDDIQSGYFHYDDEELQKIPQDIRGLRSYRVSGLGRGAIGANEWHRVRNELLFVTRGSAELVCEDSNRETSVHILDHTKGLWLPPFILHTYKALEDDTELLVVANTLFVPDDPSTHDTYTAESFKDLQNEVAGS